MKIERLTLLVEAIGTFAIIVSLIFVALQIRENTRANYAASYDAIAVSQIEWRMHLATNPEMRKQWGEFLQPRLAPNLQQSASDGLQHSSNAFILEALLLNYERAFYARKYERFGDEEWERYERSMCASAALAPLVMEINFTQDFLAFIRECGRTQENPVLTPASEK